VPTALSCLQSRFEAGNPGLGLGQFLLPLLKTLLEREHLPVCEDIGPTATSPAVCQGGDERGKVSTGGAGAAAGSRSIRCGAPELSKVWICGNATRANLLRPEYRRGACVVPRLLAAQRKRM